MRFKKLLMSVTLLLALAGLSAVKSSPVRDQAT